MIKMEKVLIEIEMENGEVMKEIGRASCRERV